MNIVLDAQRANTYALSHAYAWFRTEKDFCIHRLMKNNALTVDYAYRYVHTSLIAT
ncbi:MAG: hypothetical protein WBI82_02440 [Sphaerochaeta sp.]